MLFRGEFGGGEERNYGINQIKRNYFLGVGPYPSSNSLIWKILVIPFFPLPLIPA